MAVQPFSLFSEQDIYLFKEGKHYKLYEKFGSHSLEINGEQGVYFAVWSPNSKQVSVVGDFNHWEENTHILYPRWDNSGIWEGFIPGLQWGEKYKYAIYTEQNNLLHKSDPFALSWEQGIQAASLVSTNWYEWTDQEWLHQRQNKNPLNSPISVYEMHIGSWIRNEGNKMLNYRELAKKLIPYLKEMGFTYVEFMPIMEHPYEPSWGYQITGFYAANSRFGSPQDLMFLINELHKNNIGVILDWVPSHFPADANGLYSFNGTSLYEYQDKQKGYHPQWNSYIFDYGKNEVKSFLISNALFWLDRYHADGIRVDAVTSMLYLDYARNEGEWKPNIFGGNVNLEAKTFLQELNIAVKKFYPNVMTIAEESSDFPKLTHPVEEDGVGFDMKWMMGWMHDTLKYYKEDPIFRKHHHKKITFTSMYMHKERYILPLSHDEVVHGKSSMIYKMHGDEWQKFAHLRTLYTYMYTISGAKLLFMGNEFGQTHEWDFGTSLDWHLLQYPIHSGLQKFIKTLNELYTSEKALYQYQFSPKGFQWIEADDADNSIFIYLRKSDNPEDSLMTILNLTPRIVDYTIKNEEEKHWQIILNSDDELFGGSGVKPEIQYTNHLEFSLKIPPLAALILK